MASARPVEIRLKRAEKILELQFDDGETYRIPAELLRVESPSAEVQGHSPDQRQLVAGAAGVGISRLEQVGNYAIRIVFDDGHDTGLFTWKYLYEMGRDYARNWARYQARVAASTAAVP
jgi:DUF971 family protein